MLHQIRLKRNYHASETHLEARGVETVDVEPQERSREPGLARGCLEVRAHRPVDRVAVATGCNRRWPALEV